MKKDRGSNGKADPVAQAEQALAGAKATLAATSEEIQAREMEVARLREEIGSDPSAKETEAKATRVVVAESRLGHLLRQRPGQEAAVREAEGAVKAAEAARAQGEVDGANQTLDTLNAQIGEALNNLLALIRQHEGIIVARDALTRQFNLPTAGRRKFLFPTHLLRSNACEVLRARLDIRMATGIKEERPPVELNPFSGAPTALPPMT